jgi:hypothetical protein
VVSPVKSHDGELAGGDLVYRGHARLVPRRHVDRHIRNVARAQEREGAVAVAGVHPFRLAQLDRDLESEHALLDLLDISERAR